VRKKPVPNVMGHRKREACLTQNEASLRCGISARLTAALGQNRQLPHRNIGVRFTLNERT
jgi:hypothetical protein